MNAQAERREGTDRRAYSLNTLKNCVVAPRRMYGRRKGDRRYALLDRFDSGVVMLAVVLMILSILDAVFTLSLITRGGTEANPFMNALLQHSVWAFTGFKMLLTGIPAIMLVATGNLLLFGRYRARSILAALVGLYLGLMTYHVALLIISS
ncbi:MAG: DUF5658 family protein [Granulosicoccus sp.]